jgi:hypothetical protein
MLNEKALLDAALASAKTDFYFVLSSRMTSLSRDSLKRPSTRSMASETRCDEADEPASGVAGVVEGSRAKPGSAETEVLMTVSKLSPGSLADVSEP